jgi:hypothetical protein
MAGCSGALDDGPARPFGYEPRPTEPTTVEPGPRSHFDLTVPSTSTGIRLLTRAELSRTVEALTGQVPDISQLPAEIELVNLINDASRLTVRNATHQRALLTIATQTANDADLARAFPCETTCTDEDVRALLERAFVDVIDDASVAEYRAIYDGASAERGDDFGRRAVIQQVLLSPRLLYRSEIGRDGALRAPELARKLAFFLWGTPPDDALLQAALDGSLATDSVYLAQIDRMLADDRARARVVEIFEAWLHLSPPNLAGRPAAEGLPETIVASMRRELEEAITRGVFDDGLGLREILTRDRTWVDGDLAALYGISGVTGTELQEVSLAATERRGLLTTAYVLATHAKHDGRSPMLRGKFLLDAVTCQTFPPDAGVAVMALPPATGDETFRERFASLEETRPCSYCHRTLNAGFALDVFDGVGRRWPLDRVGPEEAAGLFDLAPYEPIRFSTTPEAITAFASHPALSRCFVIQTYRIAAGALPGSEDAATIDAIERSFLDGGQDVRALLRSIATSPRFRQSSIAGGAR